MAVVNDLCCRELERGSVFDGVALHQNREAAQRFLCKPGRQRLTTNPVTLNLEFEGLSWDS